MIAVTRAIALALLAHCPTGAAAGQDSGQQRGSRPNLDLEPALREAEREPLLASDRKPVAPGRIPQDTSEPARALWKAVRQATWTGAEPPRPVDSFALTFDVTGRHESGKNDFTIDVLFQDRGGEHGGWLRTQIHRSGRVQLRGPEGDWLIDKDQVTSLAGRENVVSRRDMDQWIAIASNFLALVNTDTVRLVSLRQGASPVERLPREVRARAEGLEWLEVMSPDFHLYPVPAGSRQPIFRATLGVRPEDGRVALSLIEDSDPRNADFARAVAHDRWSTVGEHRLPRQLHVYVIDPEVGRFYPRPYFELTVYKGGVLNPGLDEASFRKPR